MPLVEQQDIVHCMGQTYEEATAKLKEILETYPPVKIVSISADRSNMGTVWLLAVVETI